MSYYLRQYTIQGRWHAEVWRIETNTAFRIGISNPPVFNPDDGETVWDALRRMTG
jgi:hypothetical protein